MSEKYEPPSDFLKSIIADEVPLSGSSFGTANFARLLLMIHDPDRANRDWAVMLLSQQEVDSPAIQEALLAAAGDEDEYVRAEAILGLAQRAPSVATPFLKKELSRESVSPMIFEAATLVADPTLIDNLLAFSESSGNDYIDQLALEAIAACKRG